MPHHQKMQDSIKKKLLNKALEVIQVEGWHSNLLKNLDSELKLPQGTASAIFPGGVTQLAEFYNEYVDNGMIKEYNSKLSSYMKISEKIRLCIISRIKFLSTNKIAYTKYISLLGIPTNLNLAARLLWKTADLIWREAGNDTSVDFNYYTKRAILSAVYTSTIMYWLNDDSEDFSETISFLDRKLYNVGQIGKIKRKLSNFLDL